MFTQVSFVCFRLVSGLSICGRCIHTGKMPYKLAANISMLFMDKKSMIERYELANKFGFKFVECTYPYAEPLDQLKSIKQKLGLDFVLMNSYIAMIHCGLGPEQMNSLFSTLNIPPLTVKAMKEREREIGKSVESTALSTCEEAIIEEEQLSLSNPPDTEESGNDEKLISVSFDGAWQKRGNPAAGDRGLAALPSRKQEFRDKLGMVIDYAKGLECKRVHVLAGNTEGLDQQQCEETYLENIGHAADRFHKEGITCMIEPINRRVTIPGYFLSDIQKAVNIIDKLKRPNIKLQFDFFHIQILHGDLTANLKKYLPYIGHIQIAQVPNRDEPGNKGEIDYSYVFKLLEEVGYEGYIGLEYTPKGDTVEGLQWIKDMGLTL